MQKNNAEFFTGRNLECLLLPVDLQCEFKKYNNNLNFFPERDK